MTKYNENNVEYDNGVEYTSPYHNSATCYKCIYDAHLDSVRRDFRAEYERLEELSYDSLEDKINALYELEDMFPEIGVDIDAIINKGKSYLDF